jgi:hypothetical protein
MLSVNAQRVDKARRLSRELSPLEIVLTAETLTPLRRFAPPPLAGEDGNPPLEGEATRRAAAAGGVSC